MAKTEFKALDEMIDHLRAKGVVSYKGSTLERFPDGGREQIELVLLPDEPMKPVKEPKKSVDEILESGVKKKGADGLTAEAQEDLYGVVIDAGT